MRLPAAVCASLIFGLGAAAPAAALDEGAVDGPGHPNVGALAVDADGDGPEPVGYWCSGSVISPNVFLTAGHCIAGVPPGAVTYVTLAPGSPRRPMSAPGVFPDEFPFALTVPATKAEAAVVHPRFDPETGAHDVAVVIFRHRPFAGVRPVELPREGEVDRVNHKTFRLVGYGSDPERGNGETQFILEGYRQTRTTTFERLTPARLELAGGACIGDSGSPQFVGESNLVASILSDAGEDCRGPLRGQRLDTRAERRFLEEQLRRS